MTSRFILLKSERGRGKSLGCQKALQKIKQGKSGAVMNPDFENFRTVHGLNCDSGFTEYGSSQTQVQGISIVGSHPPITIVFINGAKMYCKGLKDLRAQWSELKWFWYDEGRRDPTGLGWKNAIAFLRV